MQKMEEMKYEGVDTAARIGAAAARTLRAEGVAFAARYLVPEAGGTAWKALTAAEASEVRAAGLALLLCWELTADRMKYGAAAGAADGAAAKKLAQDMGVPAGTAVYFAADYAVPESDYAAVEAYLRAARDAVRPYRAGLYGSENVTAAMHARSACDAFWQCAGGSARFLPCAQGGQYQWQGGPEAVARAQRLGFAVDLDRAASLDGMWLPETQQKGETEMKDWKRFLAAAGIRALRTLAQTALATVGTAALLSEVDWRVTASASVLAAVLSLLTSLATGLPEAPAQRKGEDGA